MAFSQFVLRAATSGLSGFTACKGGANLNVKGLHYGSLVCLLALGMHIFLPAQAITLQQNQLGYLPKATKKLMLSEVNLPPGKSPSVILRDNTRLNWRTLYTEKGARVYKPVLTPIGGGRWQVDLSEFAQRGYYTLEVKTRPGSLINTAVNTTPWRTASGASMQPENAAFGISITNGAYWDPMTQLIRGIFLSRSGIGIYDPQTGLIREALHTQDALNADGELHDAVGGYADGGADARKTIASNAWATVMLLRLYAQNPQGLETLSLNYPSGTPRDEAGRLSDVLTEAAWGLEWLLSMQSPSGGFYAGVEDAPNPDQPRKPLRVLKPVNPTDTAIATAVLAEAASLLKPLNANLAVRCLIAAQRGWTYLQRQPGAPISETTWAAMMLSQASSDSVYHQYIDKRLPMAAPATLDNPAWLGWITWAKSGTNSQRKIAENAFLDAIRGLYLRSKQNATIADRARLLTWLSMAQALQAAKPYQAQYRQELIEQAHFILGDNALNKVFITKPAPPENTQNTDNTQNPEKMIINAVKRPCHPFISASLNAPTPSSNGMITGLLVSGPVFNAAKPYEQPNYQDASMRCTDNAALLAPTASLAYVLGVLNEF
ncbi:MAG: glycoside hydrolase family 9 protein [Vampirovibrionales bacterium]|nr:glycoside hydrolase family 9 protein [Vampirovibrionales bacterium]